MTGKGQCLSGEELRERLKPKREPILEEPGDIDQYDFTVVRPNNHPRPSRRLHMKEIDGQCVQVTLN